MLLAGPQAQARGPGGGKRRGGRLHAVIQGMRGDAPGPGGGGAPPRKHRLSRSSSASDMVELGLSAVELDRLKGVQPAGARRTPMCRAWNSNARQPGPPICVRRR